MGDSPRLAKADEGVRTGNRLVAPPSGVSGPRADGEATVRHPTSPRRDLGGPSGQEPCSRTARAPVAPPAPGPGSVWPTVALVVSVKAYVLCALYVLFLRTELRDGAGGFWTEGSGETVEERAAKIEGRFWDRLTPYDGQLYLDIAANGYRAFERPLGYGPSAPPGNYAFFPLLPAILRGTRALLGSAYIGATIVLISAASAAGAVLLWRLAQDLAAPATLSLVLLLAFPTAVYQSVLYTEGLFLLFSVGALVAVQRGKWIPAAAFGLLAGLTRPQGFLLALPFFWRFLLPVLTGRERTGLLGALWRTVVVAVPLIGFVGLSAYVHVSGIGPSAGSLVSVQEYWGRSCGPRNVWAALRSVIDYAGPRFDLVGVAFGVALLPVVWRRLPAWLSVYATGMVLLPLMTGTILSMGRFLSMSVPHFLALAIVLSQARAWVRWGTVVAFVATQVLVANGLIAWHAVG